MFVSVSSELISLDKINSYISEIPKIIICQLFYKFLPQKSFHVISDYFCSPTISPKFIFKEIDSLGKVIYCCFGYYENNNRENQSNSYAFIGIPSKAGAFYNSFKNIALKHFV